MNDATADALARLNQRFYDASGEAFSATRRRGWRGWKRLLPHLERTARAEAPARVLDLGCGNGRLAGFLREPGLRLDYQGFDGSRTMIETARESFGDDATRFELAAFHQGFPPIHPRTNEPARAVVFDLVAIFGVMHHLPDRTRRARFLEQAWRRVAPGGLLAISWWRFQRDPRFASRCLAWDAPEIAGDEFLEALDPCELEEGDTLLRFGEEPGPPRYCHFASDEEIEVHLRAFAAEPGISIERYDDDGDGRRLNHYALIQRPPEGC